MKESSAAIEQAVRILEKGGVLAHATETCYGFACDLTNLDAVKRLFALKGRPLDQPVSALFPNLASAEKYVVFSKKARDIAEAFLPGPLTIVLPRRTNAPKLFVTPHEKQESMIGLRISSHQFALSFAEKFGKPIATTSANLHGKPNPYSPKDISSQFRGRTLVPDLLIDGGTLPIAPPSTVVAITGEGLKTLRQGDLRLQ